MSGVGSRETGLDSLFASKPVGPGFEPCLGQSANLAGAPKPLCLYPEFHPDGSRLGVANIACRVGTYFGEPLYLHLHQQAEYLLCSGPPPGGGAGRRGRGPRPWIGRAPCSGLTSRPIRPISFGPTPSRAMSARRPVGVIQLRGGKKTSCGAQWLQTHAIGDAGPFCGQETLSPFRHKILRI